MSRNQKQLIRSLVPLLLLFLFTSTPQILNAQEQKKTYVAVMDLNMSGGIPESYQETLSDRLRMELHNTGKFNVVERNVMGTILEEQGLQVSSCTTDDCAVQMGRLLGVERMIAGSIGRVGNSHSIILRMIDVETGLIVATKNADCRCDIEDVMSTQIQKVAQALASPNLDNAQSAWKDQAQDNKALPRSFFWPGLGQIRTGRKKIGYTYLAVETVVMIGMLTSVGEYNERVKTYTDAEQWYQDASDPNDIQFAYEEKEVAYMDAESAREQVSAAFGLFTVLYVWNIVDAMLFTKTTNHEVSIIDDDPSNELSFTLIPDSRGEPSAGISYGFRFDITGGAER